MGTYNNIQNKIDILLLLAKVEKNSDRILTWDSSKKQRKCSIKIGINVQCQMEFMLLPNSFASRIADFNMLCVISKGSYRIKKTLRLC